MSLLSLLPYSDQLRTSVFFTRKFGLGGEQFDVLGHYLSGKLFPEYDDQEHLQAAMEWLCQAQDKCGGNGVSNVFYLKTGWGVAYPETSGYIMATYLAYADHSGDSKYVERARGIGDWEISIQAHNGGVLSSTTLPQTRVFNTGQVVLGWCALYEKTGEEKYLHAAARAGDYLISEQEHDGAWRKDTYCGARTYHARVDWSLLRLAQLTNDKRYAETARKNLKWVVACQNQQGWFRECGFENHLPVMHVIVYTLRGLLECHAINHADIADMDLLDVVMRGADPLCTAIEQYPVGGIKGMVPTSFDENWQSSDSDSCLTGNAQMSCFLYRLSHMTGVPRYKDLADSIVSATKRTQLVRTGILPLKGAIAGTYPLSHGYVPNGFPNWATKFFADALLTKMNFDRKLAIPA